MRKEILRMDQVTYEHQGVTQLDNFSAALTLPWRRVRRFWR